MENFFAKSKKKHENRKMFHVICEQQKTHTNISHI